jgi:tubulin-specific chaperone A
VKSSLNSFTLQKRGRELDQRNASTSSLQTPPTFQRSHHKHYTSPTDTMAPPSQLSIATSSVQRLVKEEASYYKELQQQEARLEKALAAKDEDENAEYQLKQEASSRFFVFEPTLWGNVGSGGRVKKLRHDPNPAGATFCARMRKRQQIPQILPHRARCTKKVMHQLTAYTACRNRRNQSRLPTPPPTHHRRTPEARGSSCRRTRRWSQRGGHR